MANRAHTLLKDREVPRPRTPWLSRLERVWPLDASRRSPERATVSEAQELLRQAEINGERVAALFRLIIFGSLLSVVAFTDQGLHRLDMTTWLLLYGVGTLVGIGLAWRGIFYPPIPYLFVTFDIVMVSIQLLLLTRMIGMPPTHSFAMPVATLVFVIMVHASMRYRPWLVVYAAVLFVLAIQAGGLLFAAGEPFPDHWMHMQHQGAMGELVLFQVFPITIIGLSALILFVIGRRTRRLLIESIDQTYRVAKLSRYFSPNVADQLAASPDERLLAGTRQPAAVLFVDVQGFTAMAESMDPSQLGAFLSELRRRPARPVFEHEGTVDKFIGDAIMAVFGTPRPRSDDARRALACALDMLGVIERWSKEREQAGLPPIRVGIGGHFGEVFAGALGSEELLEYTVIGDTVNIAERLERLTRQLDRPLVVSSALLQGGGEVAASRQWERLEPQHLPGHRGVVEVFALAPAPSGSAHGLKDGQMTEA